ncbi:uncharacterized protein MYU51_011957 [Penicillium brevicompactum]|uniref:uncharacterized protein n=1 Tax=Penicillium brevicompactum TaxID=5074 RepID=UPI002541B9AA|nr:uncharacterized protein N7506_002370 [Penicillium brevicompactum]KAJ5349117.1 hypothetical protein N7506_002370 [Penicillium brevicompactum]
MTARTETRRSRFNLWIPTKVASEKQDASPPNSGSSESPTSDSGGSRQRRKRIRVRISRSGSRILSLLGLRGSKANKESITDTDCSNYMQADAENAHPTVISSPGGDGNDSPQYLTEAESPRSEPLPVTPSCNTPMETVETLSEQLFVLQTSPEPRNEPGAEDILQRNVATESQTPTMAEQPTPTNPKFVNRFSHKISLALGQPTVIRRTGLRARPSILRVDQPGLEDMSKQGDGANDVSEPSTSPSSTGSPFSKQSTTFTPQTTCASSPSSDKVKLYDEHEQSNPVNQWPLIAVTENDSEHLSDAKEDSILPSIKTVENTAVAKVCLELHFSSIFHSENSREHRQLELERQIYAFELTPEEQLMTMHNWILGENDYLRQCRVLKSNKHGTEDDGRISLAGYKAIKVLGKGSFGVVRLVRKLDSDLKVAHNDKTLPVNDTSTSSRSKPLGLLMSAVEGAKQTRRRYMTGETKEFYAMKVIKKTEMIRNCQEGHIRAERDFLVASASSRWVVPLISSFQDTHNLYLVMDYMIGGDFLSLLIRRDTLREDWARFYVAEMILCIEEAHRLFWIHRDVKPDNFLISASGHLKISDFGLAFNGHWSHDQDYYNSQRYTLIEKLGIEVKGDAEDQKPGAEHNELAPGTNLPSAGDYASHQPPCEDLLAWREENGRRRFARSVVGTSQYMAPEVIRGEMYDGRCDWWSLGIILYECLYGFTPFACENRYDTKVKILQHSQTLQFPREKPSDRLVSAEALDLMTRILQEREYRLCSPKYRSNDVLIGRPVSKQILYSMNTRYRNISSYYVYPNDATDIKIHPFFRGIRWQDLHLCQPPMVPRVRNWEDTRYFENAVSELEKNAQLPEQQSEDTCPGAEAGAPTEKPVVGDQSAGAATTPAPNKANVIDKKKEKKRPRDKILRDKQLNKAALDIRKNGAFLGYTYRRPNEVALAFSSERGRSRSSRGELASLFSS